MPCKSKEVCRCAKPFAVQNGDERKRQLKLKIQEDQRLHAEQMNTMLHQGQAEVTRLRSIGTKRRTVEGYCRVTRAQAKARLTEASRRTKKDDLTDGCPAKRRRRNNCAN